VVTTLLGFAAGATLVILAPGPDSLLVTRNTLHGGRKAGMITAAGTLTGLLIWAITAGLGLAALLAASRVGYDVLRIAGAGYLIWLGATSLLPRLPGGAHCDGRAGHDSHDSAPVLGTGRAYLNGLITNLCNPKVGAFFVAFLPGFVPAGVPAREFSFLLGLWFVAQTGVWLTTIAWLASRGSGWFSRLRSQRRLEQLTGIVLIGLGIRLAAEAR